MRLPTNYNEVRGLSVITPEDLYTIHNKAKALTLDECFELIAISVDDISSYDLRICKIVHKRGKAEGIAIAVDSLFAHMKSKQGGATCIDYLRQHSGSFALEKTSSGSGFNFNVVMKD